MKRGETFLSDDFRLTEKTLEWLEAKSPTLNIDETLEIFRDKAAAKGWVYRDWQAAFRNYVRNGNLYGGLVFRAGRADDPRWKPVLAEAASYGFREPLQHETPASYRTAFQDWKTAQKRAPCVIPLSRVLQR